MNNSNNNNTNSANNNPMRSNYLEQDSHTLRDYINLIKLNFVPILLITITGLVVAIIYAINAPNIYKSTTALKISKPSGSILSSSIMPEFQDFGSDRFIANEIEILKSYSLRERVTHTLVDSFYNLKEDSKFSIIFEGYSAFSKSEKKSLKTTDDIVKSLATAVSIDQKRGLDIVEISAESESPFESALIANVYANAYRLINLSYNRTQLVSVKEFLARQREEKLNELATVEETLRNYQEQKGIVEIGAQATSLIEQSAEFDAKKNSTQIELTISQNTLKQYKEELARKDPDIKAYVERFASEPYIQNLQKQIADLKGQKDRALAGGVSNQKKTEVVAQYDQRISELTDKLNSQLSVYQAGILASSPDEIKELTQKVLEAEIKTQAMSASYKRLSEIVNDYDRKMSELPTSSIDLARLKREQSAYEKLYLTVEEKYQEALINEQSTPGNVIIIDAGLIPTSPAKPNRILIIVVGFVLGAGLGLGYSFLRNYFDNTIKTPEDIQNRNINILAWIPQIEGVGAEKKEFEFIVAKKPDSTVSEAFRALRTRIKFSKIGDKNLKTILVTSSTSGEGKTTVSVNLAGSFAQANFKTLLIDCDLRKPRVHTIFGQKRFPGITDYFFGQAEYDEIVRSTNVNNLDYITSGTIPPNPSEILGSNQMEEFLEKIKEIYDYIIIDSPPLIAVTDSEIISRFVDASLLVVSANQTEVELMEKAVTMLNHEQNTFIGTVLNNFSYKSGYSSYYKYYYYYSRPAGGDKKSRAKV
ncbi:hypothetical protein APF79_14180 [bacterium BRH_c32]|nr:MAG: hypothetical protein APF79_14180 [bacterium BRH_c32]